MKPSHVVLFTIHYVPLRIMLANQATPPWIWGGSGGPNWDPEVKTLKSLMAENGHKHIDILKVWKFWILREIFFRNTKR